MSEPVAIFVDNRETLTIVPLVMDERVFSDTILRVMRLSARVYLACDLRYLNGAFLYNTLSYPERIKKLDDLLDMFHSTDLTALIGQDCIPEDTPIHGWESYDTLPGTMGVFLPADE